MAECPCCGQPLPEEATTASMLARWCSENGHAVSADGSVSAEVAAAILERSTSTLTNWRAQGAGPRYRRGGRVRYRLADLAEFLDSGLNAG